MKRVRVEVEVTRRTSMAFDVDDDADREDINATALEEAELAEGDEDPPAVVSIEIIDPSQRTDFYWRDHHAHRLGDHRNHQKRLR